MQKSKEIICLFSQKSKEISHCFLVKVTKNLCVSKEYFTFVVLKIINMKYIFIVEKTNTGYSAYAVDAVGWWCKCNNINENVHKDHVKRGTLKVNGRLMH